MEKPLELILNEFKRDMLSLINAREYKGIPLIIKQMCFNEVKATLDEVVTRVTNEVIEEYSKKQKLLKNNEKLENDNEQNDKKEKELK